MNQSSSVVVSSEQIEASRLFGLIVHRCAVRARGKSALADKAGLVPYTEDQSELEDRRQAAKMMIVKIISGEGHLLDKEVVGSVARAASRHVAPNEVRYLGDLVSTMLSSRRVRKTRQLLYQS